MEVSIRISPNSDDNDELNNQNNNQDIMSSGNSNQVNNQTNIFSELINESSNSIFNNNINNNNNSSNNNINTSNVLNSNNISSGFLNGSFTNSITSRLSNPFSQLYNNNHSAYSLYSYSNNNNNGNLSNSNSNNNIAGLLNNSIHRTNSDLNIDEGIHINPPNTTTTTTTTTTTNNTTNNINNNTIPTTTTTNTLTEGETPLTSTSNRIDIQMLLKWAEQNFAFMMILFIVFLYSHRQGIFVFIWQQVVFIQANFTLKNQVALQEKRNIGVLTWLIIMLSSNIYTTYLFFHTYELWRSLIFLLPNIGGGEQNIDIWLALTIVTHNDFMARFFGMIIKAIAVIAVGHKPPFKRRNQLYTIIEVFNHLYRCILPIPIWTAYLHSLNRDGEHIFSSLMIGLYLTFKLTTLIEKSKQCGSILRAYILREVIYGKKATFEQIQASGDLCVICQEKMISPIALRCNHLFCEDCVSQWLQLEKTCPVCRASIASAGNRTHSDGTTNLLLQIF